MRCCMFIDEGLGKKDCCSAISSSSSFPAAFFCLMLSHSTLSKFHRARRDRLEELGTQYVNISAGKDPLFVEPEEPAIPKHCVRDQNRNRGRGTVS